MADDDDKPPRLNVVSDNPTARADREFARVKERARRALAEFAASILRVMAGSATESHRMMDRFRDFIDALNEANAQPGRGITLGELEKALRLPQTEMELQSHDDLAYRRWARVDAMETIVTGALRLGAHKLLGERPHFGGKYSEDLIRDGIRDLEELKRTPPKPKSVVRQRVASSAPPADDPGPGPRTPRTPTKPTRKKPWSSRDSVSYRDLKARDE